MNDDQLVKGILERNSKAIDFLYNTTYPVCKKMILQSGGSDKDAEDLFHDALMVLYLKLREEDFKIESSIHAYLYGVVRFKWYRLVKRGSLFINEEKDTAEQENIEQIIIENEKRKLFNDSLSSMGEDCKKVLTYFFEGKKMAEIAVLMDYKSERIAKKKKYLCKERLIEIIKNSSGYKELLEGS